MQRPGINIGNAVETPDATDAWQMNVQILALCNEQRQNNGLEKLMTREDLWEQVAQVRAGEIVNYFSHTRPNGSNCFSLYDEAGLDYRAAGENIAAGYYGASAVVDGWMNSTGHRANILSESYDYLATGYATGELTVRITARISWRLVNNKKERGEFRVEFPFEVQNEKN